MFDRFRSGVQVDGCISFPGRMTDLQFVDFLLSGAEVWSVDVDLTFGVSAITQILEGPFSVASSRYFRIKRPSGEDDRCKTYDVSCNQTV